MEATMKGLNSKEMSRWRANIFARDKWRCLKCGRKGGKGVLLTLDHIKPRSKGGKATADNLQTLCKMCNEEKGAREEDYREPADSVTL